jgi:DNA invertase Pin-like site-specific DNA recombinase
MEKKLVYTLYRVSTKGQVDVHGNDIPMQRTACHDFAKNHPDWEIIKEVSELGVSGYSKGADDRDGLQEIIRDATTKKYDILLVFKFDRLGRKYNETPFILENLVSLGIEVWSTTEGQQTFSNSTDSLINFMRFWQANTESANTSIRVKTAMGQMVLDGHHKGGIPPYGYKLEHRGRINKRGHPVKDRFIDEDEAFIVTQMFDQYVHVGTGFHRLASYLNGEGYRNRNGKIFLPSTMRSMLKNPAYTGRLICGESETEPYDHLRIIDDETYYRAQEIMKQRSNDCRLLPWTDVPLNVKGDNLLNNILYCGSCGGKFMSSTNGSKCYKRKDGSTNTSRYRQYVCYTKKRYKEECNGRYSIRAHVIEDVIVGAVKDMFANLGIAEVTKLSEAKHDKEVAVIKERMEEKQKEISKLDGELVSLQSEVLMVIKGESAFTQEILTDLITKMKKDKQAGEKELAQIKKKYEKSNERAAAIKEDGKRLITYAKTFADSSAEMKKMIIHSLIERVTLFGDKVDIEWKLNASDYFGCAETTVNGLVEKARER